MTPQLAMITIVALVVLILFMSYNSLIRSKMRVAEALSQIDVQLKRRVDLIPNLVGTVKGYATHEKEVFDKVIEARTLLLSAKGLTEKATANEELSKTLKSLFALSENYPDLKASQNFLELQEEITDTENKIAYARQFYNSNVMEYNTKLSVFPTVLIAKPLFFKPKEFFEAKKEEGKAVKVSF